MPPIRLRCHSLFYKVQQRSLVASAEVDRVMEEIDSLRQQLSAAEFLVNSLRGQLQRAEQQYAAAQQFHHHRMPSRGSSAAEATPNDQDVAYVRDESRVSEHEGLERDLQSTLNHPETPFSHPQSEAQNDAGDQEGQAYPGGAIDEYLRSAGQSMQVLEDAHVQPVQPVQPAEYPVPPGTALPDISVKRIFPDLSSVKGAVEAYALAQGWTAATKKRDRLRICMGCRSVPNCPFHVRAETCAEGARISACKLLHTCQAAVLGGGPTPKRQQISRLKFLREEVPKLIELTPTTPTKDIQEAVFLRFGTRISLAQCSKLKGPTRHKRPAAQGCSRCGVQGHNKQTCKA